MSLNTWQHLPMADWLKPYTPLLFNIAYAVVILCIGWLLAKWANKLVLATLRKARAEEALARFLGSVTLWTVMAAALISALNRVGVQTTSLVAVLASAGLAIGLALQGSLANFASGVMILGFRPFMLGDYVELAGRSGTVDDIGLFQIRLVAPGNETVILPNATVMSNPITNYSAKGVRRGTIDVGVAYGVEVERVFAILEEVATKCSKVLESPAPSVWFVNFGASSLDFKVNAYCKAADFIAMTVEMHTLIYNALNEADIEIPFNQIVVHQAGTEG